MRKRVLSLSIATGLIQMYPKAHPILTQPSEGDLRFGDTGCGQTLPGSYASLLSLVMLRTYFPSLCTGNASAILVSVSRRPKRS